MHSEVVTIMSSATVMITGPALACPSSATSSGTPINPELGNAVTKAPKAASFQPQRRRVAATAPATTNRPHSK